jgi:hypothetical protein
MSDEDTKFLMQMHIEATVPLLIHDYLKCRGIDEQHFAYARNVLAWDIAQHGDALLYKEGTTRDKKTGETRNIGTAEMVNKLVEGLAILSFCPGGVTFLGLHFEASEIAKRLGIAMEPEEPIEEPIESEASIAKR